MLRRYKILHLYHYEFRYARRLSWERAFTAAVLIGYDEYDIKGIQDKALLPSEHVEKGVTALLEISRILCQTHMSR